MKINISLSAAAKFDTSLKLLAFLKGLGGEQYKGPADAVQIRFSGPIASKLAPLKVEWAAKTVGDKKIYTNITNSTKVFTLMTSGKYAFIYWDRSNFVEAATVDIYKVTQYHPAWLYVEDYKDQHGTGKNIVKEAVDSYIKELGMTIEQLSKSIVARTKSKTRHPLYGTD